MNNDIYAEWLVKRKAPGYLPLIYLGVGVVILLSILLMLQTSWGFIIFALVVIGCFFGRRLLSIEYEYIFVTNELAIDKIYNQMSRKTIRRVNMSNVETIEPRNEERNKNLLAGKKIQYEDFTSHEENALPAYTIIFTDQDGKRMLDFEPSEKLLHAMWRSTPSKVHIQK